MSDQNIQGVDLAVGKLSLPLSLASITGPNNFGDTLTLQYSTLGLLKQIRTWNEEAHTDVVGLGWYLSEQYIMRIGNGSLDDQFVWSQDKSEALVLKSKILDANTGIYTLEFATATHSLNKITYQTIPNDVNSPETWTIVDANGVTYTYGGNQAAIDWGVRWVATDEQSPLVWIGTSTATENQTNYALMWRLASKENIYGQRVEYDYFSVEYNVGTNGQGLSYTMASYLQAIRVLNGETIQLSYADKNLWEYPQLRISLSPQTGSSNYKVTNAYQDRVVTKYVQSVSVYNAEGNLKSLIELGYDFLFQGFTPSNNTNLPNVMQKRVLTSVSYLSPNGQLTVPAQLFNYWGLDGSVTFNITNDNLLILTDADLATSYTYTDNYQQTHNYGALYGHLQTVTTSQGVVTWYSYREVSANYAQVSWPAQDQSYAWESNWKNQLDLANIQPPASETSDGVTITWTNPRPFWGADNYVVIVWDSDEDSQVSKIALQIFEWLGCWLEVDVYGVGLTFGVSDDFREYGDECIKFGMGSGKFALCRLGISSQDTQMGLVTLFNRDPYLPGVWHLTAMLNSEDTANTSFAVVEPNDTYGEGWMYQQLEVNVGTHIVSVLDKQGATLYLYSLVDNTWTACNPTSIGTSACGSIVNNDDVFVYGYDVPQVYWLYRFDVTQPIDSAWNSISRQSSFPDLAQLVNPNNSGAVTVVGFAMSPMVNGVYLAQGFVYYDQYSNYSTIFPFIISWNILTSDTNTWQINLQAINTPNPDGNNGYGWGNWVQYSGLDKGSSYGSLMSSNLINFIPVSGEGNRYVTRYIGGGSYDASNNTGWLGDSNFSSLQDDSDQWCQLATLDTTVAISNPDSNPYNYSFYQYTPYGNSGDSSHPYWIAQSAVSSAMGQNTDWENILATVNEVLMLVGVFFQGISAFLFFPGVAVAEALAVTSNLLKWAVRAYEFADFMINNVAGLTAQFVLGPIAKNALAGRSAGSDMGMGYLMVGQGSVSADSSNRVSPTAFAKVWDPATQAWTWQKITNFPLATVEENASNLPWQVSMYENCTLTFLGQDLYSYGNRFIPFSYVGYQSADEGIYLRVFYFDHVAFFQNGQCLAVDLMPAFSFGPQTVNGQTYNATSLPYLFYNNGWSETQPTPVMSAAWGGVLGYQPPINLYYNDSDEGQPGDDAYETSIPDEAIPVIPISIQPSLFTAQNLLLTLARDGLLQGGITDYVVDQVVKDDGYQTYNTFFQYMPTNAVYQPIESVVYNQVRVAAGEKDYTSSAINNGWSEYYFYNGGFNYQGSHFGNSTLPYDPAAEGDTFSQVNQSQTNVSNYYSLMTGKLYCQRTLKSQDGSSDFSEGYEVSRQQIFYQAYETYLAYDSSNTPLTQQKTTGVLPTLTVKYVAPANTTTADITDAYAAGQATLQSSYYFYDLMFTDRNNNAISFSGPWSPADATTPYQLGLNSALPLGKLSFNYHQTAVQSALAIEGYYTQTIPGVSIPENDSAAQTYQQFSNFNLYNATVQKITWYHPNLAPATNAGTTLNFATPATAWNNPNSESWQIISSSANTWQLFTDNQYNPLCWYPASRYAWQGTADGSPQLDPWSGESDGAFTWSAPPVNAQNTPWLQQGSTPVEMTASGIVLASQTTTELVSYSTYDQQLRWPIMQVTNAGLPGSSAAFYVGFETYEDLSNWTFTNNGTTAAMAFSPCSYAGNRSLMIAAVANTPYTLSINLGNVTPNQDTWLLAVNMLAQNSATEMALTIQVAANAGGKPNQGTSLITQTVTPTTSWVNYCLPIDLSTVTALTDITLTISSAADATIYIDNLYMVPAQNTQFATQSYDLATLAPVASASPTDPAFCIRTLYDNRGRMIGTVRKATQSPASQWLGSPQVAAQIQLSGRYYSRDGYSNQDSFNATDPNASLQMIGGANQPAAGYYFDFRDGVNLWHGGSVIENARALLLDVSQSATYSIPTNLNWGVGIRAQIQGYVEPVTSMSLSSNDGVTTPQAVSLPTPTVSDCFQLWGAFIDTSNASAGLYNFNLSLDISLPSAINQANSAGMNGAPVLNNQQFLTCSPLGDLMFGVTNADGSYEIMNPIGLYTTNSVDADSSIPTYAPIAASNNLVYVADNATALSRVTSIEQYANASLASSGQAADLVSVVTYSDVIPNATCPLPPAIDAEQRSIVWLLTSTKPNDNSSQALQFTAGQNGTAQVVDAANVLNFDHDEDFTIECWVNCPSIQESFTYILSRWGGATNGHAYPYVIRVDNKGYVYAARYDLAQNNPSVASTTRIFDSQDSQFHHIAFVRQTDITGQGHLLLYIDGILEGQGIDNTMVSTQSDAPLILNDTLYSSDQTEGNQIMELRIWNYARTATQINVNKQRQLTGYEGGLVGYWPFNGNTDDLSPYQQNMSLSSAGCQYANLPAANTLPAPASAWVKYDTALEQTTVWVIGSKKDALPNVTIPPTVSADGTVFVCAGNFVYAYDAKLAFVAGVEIEGTIAGSPAAGNGRVCVANQTGTLFIYDESLNFIMSADTGLTLNSAPVIHGNKVSVVGQLNNAWYIYTYTMTGLLVTQPYQVTAQQTVSIQAFSPSLASLCVMVDNVTFMRLDFGVPVGTSISLGEYQVLYTQDSTSLHYQYQLSGGGLTTASVDMGPNNDAIGDWWLMVIGDVLYFYADGEQIFAQSLGESTSLPQGNFTLAAGSQAGISCRDIVVITDPSVVSQFNDGAGKLRQTQTLATVN
jgi:hypothetical protein